ncbi:hypothetical protein U9M48_003245 [Paspalum notatum var. saurae]|uniref:Reverse transcriptase Ty1/copia-type domain-containing protein n=1 Tax=Paspalum notatum var. saurae TaxID=547442 RepID=A0AAQ3PT00_PASNO
MLDEHRTPRRFWAETVNTACYIANRIFLRAFLGKTLYELRFGKQPSVKHLRAFGACALCLRRRGFWTSLSLVVWMGFFWDMLLVLGLFVCGFWRPSKLLRLVRFLLMKLCPAQPLPLSFQVMMKKAPPIFEDEEGADNVGDAGATAPAAAPAPSATSSDNEVQVEAGPAEDAGDVTSEIVPSRQVQQDHPPHRMIGDIHQRVTRSMVVSLAFFSHSAYVATFEPRDVSHALCDPNWVNAMHEELENFRNHVWDLVKPPPNCRPIGTKWVFKNKQGENGMVVRNKVTLIAQGFYQKKGIDYEETFAPVACLEAIRILLAFAASKGFKLQ